MVEYYVNSLLTIRVIEQPLVEALKQTRELYSQDALKSFQGDEIQPGPEYQTDKQLEDWLVNHGLETCYHPVSTCKIGSDDLSPVDTNFRLKGIDNLRVADASGGFSNGLLLLGL